MWFQKHFHGIVLNQRPNDFQSEPVYMRGEHENNSSSLATLWCRGWQKIQRLWFFPIQLMFACGLCD